MRAPWQLACLAVTLTSIAACQTTSRPVHIDLGNTTPYNLDSDRSGTAARLGNTTFYNLGGQTGYSNQIGGTTFYNFGGRTGYSNTIGGTTFYNGQLFGN